MKVQVIRENKALYHQRVAALGPDAIRVDIPSTLEGVKFSGVYTDRTRTAAAVAWPSDADFERQLNLARHIAANVDSSNQSEAWPVEEFERPEDRPTLTVIDGGKQ